LKVEENVFKTGSYLPNHANVDLLGPPTSLSAALRFGCLSVRKVYYAVHNKFKEVPDQMILKYQVEIISQAN
jgi:cryptochrome